jgi:transposase
VLRAKIVLAAADGRENQDIAAELQCTRRTVGTWRNRFAEHGLAGMAQDAPRGGRTPSIRGVKEAEIIVKTTQETPPNGTQWSTRSMAWGVVVSKDTVQGVWRDNGLKPHRTKDFKVSNDPQFVEKLVDVVGQYLNHPGAHAGSFVLREEPDEGAGSDAENPAAVLRQRRGRADN